MWVYFLLLAFGGTPDLGSSLQITKTYQVDDISEDLRLASPHAVDLDKDGRLYALDKKHNKIFIWNADGSFERSFGRSGEGPGELRWPMQITVYDGHLWVLDNYREKCIRFSLNGAFVDSWITPRHNYKNFNFVSDGILIPFSTTDGHSQDGMEKENFTVFQAFDKEGRFLREALRVRPDFYVRTNSDGRSVYASYGPDYDLQRSDSGDLYISFSRYPTLWRLNAIGEVEEKLTYPLSTRPPNDEEIEKFKEGRFHKKERPYEFSKEMAYFTSFLIHDNHVTFILTPIGGYIGPPPAHNYGTFRTFGLKSKKLLGKGTYDLPEDSLVFFRNGHIIVFYIDDGQEDYQVFEASFVAK